MSAVLLDGESVAARIRAEVADRIQRLRREGFGVGLGIPITRAVGVKIAYIGTRTQVGTGLDSDTFTCAVSVMF